LWPWALAIVVVAKIAGRATASETMANFFNIGNSPLVQSVCSYRANEIDWQWKRKRPPAEAIKQKPRREAGVLILAKLHVSQK
jgi:hypothetical protein